MRTAPHAARPEQQGLRLRFWVETVLASFTAVLCGVTLVWHGWLEAFGFDPDHGDGSTEWAIVLTFAGVTLALAVLARLEYVTRARICSSAAAAPLPWTAEWDTSS